MRLSGAESAVASAARRIGGVAHVDPETERRVTVADDRECEPVPRPVRHAAARRVARTEREIRAGIGTHRAASCGLAIDIHENRKGSAVLASRSVKLAAT